MNRIYIKYTPSQGSVCSSLQIYNDIKGYSCDKVGHRFFGRDADIMLEYFQNATIKRNDKVMNYGIYIKEKREKKK